MLIKKTSSPKGVKTIEFFKLSGKMAQIVYNIK